MNINRSMEFDRRTTPLCLPNWFFMWKLGWEWKKYII